MFYGICIEKRGERKRGRNRGCEIGMGSEDF
jgi:hypothetical protein